MVSGEDFPLNQAISAAAACDEHVGWFLYGLSGLVSRFNWFVRNVAVGFRDYQRLPSGKLT